MGGKNTMRMRELSSTTSGNTNINGGKKGMECGGRGLRSVMAHSAFTSAPPMPTI